MAAEHSLLLETLREIVTMLSDKSVASLIKSKDLDATVDRFLQPCEGLRHFPGSRCV